MNLQLLFPCRLLESVDSPSLVYRDPCWISVLYKIVCICSFQCPILSLDPFSPLDNHMFFFKSLSASMCSKFVQWCVFLDSNYKWYHMILVFLILSYLFSMITSRFIYVPENGIIYSFTWLNHILLHTGVISFYLCICPWAFCVSPHLGYCEWCCSECLGACVFLNSGFFHIYSQG